MVRLGTCKPAVTLAKCIVALRLLAQTPMKLDSKLPDVPSKFTLDMEEAARLKPQLTAQSVPAMGRYDVGCVTMERLVQQTTEASASSWELRIVEDGLFNAYASADGTVYVEKRSGAAGRIAGGVVGGYSVA